jgi:hypothetical protein
MRWNSSGRRGGTFAHESSAKCRRSSRSEREASRSSWPGFTLPYRIFQRNAAVDSRLRRTWRVGRGWNGRPEERVCPAGAGPQKSRKTRHYRASNGAMRRQATVLCGTLRVFLPRFGGAGRLRIAAQGKFVTPLAKAGDEALEQRFAPSVRFFCSLSGHGSLAGKNQLREVGESDGIAARDALASELPDEIAEEEIHFIGGGEAVDVREEFGGENLGSTAGAAVVRRPAWKAQRVGLAAPLAGWFWSIGMRQR